MHVSITNEIYSGIVTYDQGDIDEPGFAESLFELARKYPCPMFWTFAPHRVDASHTHDEWLNFRTFGQYHAKRFFTPLTVSEELDQVLINLSMQINEKLSMDIERQKDMTVPETSKFRCRACKKESSVKFIDSFQFSAMVRFAFSSASSKCVYSPFLSTSETARQGLAIRGVEFRKIHDLFKLKIIDPSKCFMHPKCYEAQKLFPTLNGAELFGHQDTNLSIIPFEDFMPIDHTSVWRFK